MRIETKKEKILDAAVPTVALLHRGRCKEDKKGVVGEKAVGGEKAADPSPFPLRYLVEKRERKTGEEPEKNLRKSLFLTFSHLLSKPARALPRRFRLPGDTHSVSLILALSFPANAGRSSR